MERQVGLGDTEQAVVEPALQPRKIYLKPAPKAKTIVVHEGAPSHAEAASVKTSPAQPRKTTTRTNKSKRSTPPATAPKTPPRQREDERGDEAAKHECERAAERLDETDERAAEELKKQCESR